MSKYTLVEIDKDMGFTYYKVTENGEEYMLYVEHLAEGKLSMDWNYLPNCWEQVEKDVKQLLKQG